MKSSSCTTTPDRTPACTQGTQLQQWCGLLVPQPPYIPDLVCPHFHLIGPMKNSLQLRRFADDSVHEELQHISRKFYADVHTLMQRWKKCADNGDVKNNLNLYRMYPWYM
jgi:hypothetical protein